MNNDFKKDIEEIIEQHTQAIIKPYQEYIDHLEKANNHLFLSLCLTIGFCLITLSVIVAIFS